MTIEIILDQGLCKGHGQCELLAPEYFELRDDGLAYLLKETADDDDLAVVEEAAVHCPEDAIKMIQH